MDPRAELMNIAANLASLAIVLQGQHPECEQDPEVAARELAHAAERVPAALHELRRQRVAAWGL